MLCNTELIKFKREKKFSILCVASHKVFYPATQLMCKLRHDSIVPPSKQESFSKSSFPAGLGEALNCIQSESSPTKALFHLTSHWSWHHCFPTPAQHWGALQRITGFAILRHTSHTLHKELSELCKQLRLKTNRKARALNTCLVIVLK